MIATPTKSESINYSISNNKIDLELSDNKIKTEHSLPKFSQTKQNLIKEDNLKESDANINTIHNSIISDNLEELEKLLKLGENPDIINKSGETPLYLSVDIENYDAMVILLEFGADCNIQKEDGYTPLHLAAEKKLDIYVCSLLSHGANPNIVNKTNLQSALHIGIINKLDEYVLSKFKENNGDIYNIKDKFDKSPFDYAINDEKYKNLLISIFDKNTSNNKNNDSLNIANNIINVIAEKLGKNPEDVTPADFEKLDTNHSGNWVDELYTIIVELTNEMNPTSSAPNSLDANILLGGKDEIDVHEFVNNLYRVLLPMRESDAAA